MPQIKVLKNLEQSRGLPVAEFIMHRDEMLLLDRIVEANDDVTICEWSIARDDVFVDGEQGVPAYIGVEFMAQCVAAHAGVRARIDGRGPPMGFLLGTRHFKTSVSHYQIGETYRAVCTELIRDDNGLGSYECKIVQGDSCLAEARLAVAEREKGPKLT